MNELIIQALQHSLPDSLLLLILQNIVPLQPYY